jgi:hypothetical protein
VVIELRIKNRKRKEKVCELEGCDREVATPEVGVVGSIVNRNRFREAEMGAFRPEVMIPKPSKETPVPH